MPIIRLAGSGGGGIEAAGQASAAFQQASQPGVQAFQRALEVNGQAQIQAAQIALQDQRNDAFFQDREQRAAAQRAVADRQSATMYSGAGTAAGKRVGMVPAPFTGQGVFDLYGELSELDPASADEMFAEMAQAFEGVGPLTPELIESDPRFASLYTVASQRVIQARTQRREQAIMGTYQGAVRTIQEDFGDVLSKEEIEEFGSELAVELSDPDLAPAEAAAITKAARAKAATEAGRRKHINGVVQEANDLLVKFPRGTFESFDGGKNPWDRAHQLLGDLRTAEDPDDVMAQIRLLVDPTAGAIKRRVEADTTRNVMAQQALAQIVRENKPAIDASRKSAAPSRSDLGQDMTGYRREVATQEAFGQTPGMPTQPGDAPSLKKFPNLSRVLGVEESNTEEDGVVDALIAQGLEPTPENIQRFMGQVAADRLRNSGRAPTARGALFQ